MNGNTVSSEYRYLGYYIQHWSTGTKAAMYRFEALDQESGAPIYVEFNDHVIEACKAEHFHFRASNESFDAIEDAENKWPTFYPASLDGEGMLEAFIGHDSHGDELTEEDILDRSLAEFAGEWKSLEPIAKSGELDAFFTYEAEEEGSTFEEVRASYEQNWACEVVSVTIEEDTMSFLMEDGSTCSGTYAYAGYAPIYNEDGTVQSVRYQFVCESGDAPRYVQLNDHGHMPGEVEHFHFYAGNDSFEALLEASSNSFFVPAAFSATDIMGELSSHEDHDHSHEHEEEEEMDEHVWLSLRSAMTLVGKIADAMSEVDAANAKAYQANAAAYIEKLSALDEAYAKAVEEADVKTVLFADRFPFRYLVDDYGLDYHAAFSGCSAESEASFETVLFLVNKVEELDLPAVLTIEGINHKIASTVAETADQEAVKILTMDSLQSTTAQLVADGVTYLGVMEANLEVLKEALHR